MTTQQFNKDNSIQYSNAIRKTRLLLDNPTTFKKFFRADKTLNNRMSHCLHVIFPAQIFCFQAI